MERVTLNAHLDIIKKDSLDYTATSAEYYEDDFEPNDSSLAQNALRDILWDCSFDLVTLDNPTSVRAARAKITMKGTHVNYKEFTYNATPESLVRAFKTGVVENVKWKLDVSK